MTGQATGLTRVLTRVLVQSPGDGALPVLLAVTGDLPGDSFTGPERMVHMRGGAELIGRSNQSQDLALAARLWDASERMTGVSFPSDPAPQHP
jgi:hypothetical protein